MRHLKVNSQRQSAGRRAASARTTNEIAANSVSDRNNIGKRIGTGSMPRTRRNVTQSITPSTAGKMSVTSSNQNKIPNIQNGNDQPKNRGIKMEVLLKQRDEVMPCMTGSDRVANWKSSTQYAVDYYRNEVIVSPRKQSVQKSSIQERISYGKVSSSTTFGSHSANAYDFKVPTTVQRNDNSAELIDLTDDASESNTSSITTTQEELYSYLGVVTKSQTNKVETETDNKTVKRSSLRVKVKQIALRNQEIYNQLENNRKLEAARNNTQSQSQSLVRYNGHRIEQSSVQVRQQNGNHRLNQVTSQQQQQQQYTQSTTTYKSTTLINNTTNTQKPPPPPRNNYRSTAETNRINQQQQQHHHYQQSSSSSNQLVPFAYRPAKRVQTSTNKCTVMERFVYKSKQETLESRSIHVNVDKYKTAILTSNATTVNRTTNGQPQIGNRPMRNGDVSPRKPMPAAVPSSSRDNRPPQITPGIKRKAMEQWIELTTTHPTTTTAAANNLQSTKPISTSSTYPTPSAGFAGFSQQSVRTTTNISRKIQKLDVSIYVKNTSNTFQTNSQPNGIPINNVSPTRKIDPRKYNAIQNGTPATHQKIQQQSNSSTRSKKPPMQLTQTQEQHQQQSSSDIRSVNTLTLETYSRKNVANTRITKRQVSPRMSNELKKAIVKEAHAMQNVVVNISPRKMQPANANGNAIPTTSLIANPQKYVTISPNKHPAFDTTVVSMALVPVTQSITVSRVSSVQTSSQQCISSSNGKDVSAIEVTMRSDYNSKSSSAVQLRAIQNIETTSTEKNSQHTPDSKTLLSRENVHINKRVSVQLRPIISINLPSERIDTIKHEQKVDSTKSNEVPTIEPKNEPSQSIENILLSPIDSMETKAAFQPFVDEQSEIQIPSIASTDLNENVAEDTKPDCLVDLPSSVTTDVVRVIAAIPAKRDSKTNSIDDTKAPITPIVCETNANEPIDSKSFDITGNVNNLNFLQKSDGDVLSVLSFDDQYLVVQDKLISLWTLPSELFSIFGVAQQYVCTGKIQRYNCDIEIDTPCQHRLVVVGSKTFYVELRAKKLSGTYTRESLMSIYMTLYTLNDQHALTLRHIELDRVHGSIPSIRYTILPRSRSLVISWCEVVTNVRRYNMNVNMLNVESVLIFPGCRENLKKLQSFTSDAVIAFGYSTITIWDSRSGDITCRIDTNASIGDNLHFFSLNENAERVLFLVQSCADPVGNGQLIKLLAINMNRNYSWKVICTHKLPANGAKISAITMMSKHFMAFYENGQSFLLNLYNPRQFVVHSTEAKGTKCFVINDKIIAIDHNRLVAKTFVDHFFG